MIEVFVNSAEEIYALTELIMSLEPQENEVIDVAFDRSKQTPLVKLASLSQSGITISVRTIAIFSDSEHIHNEWSMGFHKVGKYDKLAKFTRLRAALEQSYVRGFAEYELD